MVVEDLKGELVPSAIGFLRHVAACNNADLPGDRVAFFIRTAQVGWIKPGLVPRLEGFPAIRREPAGVVLTDPDALPSIARMLADEGHCRWRAEPFDVRADPAGPVLSRIDRGAVPVFGILAVGVHLNGLVQRPDGLHLWVARRAADKLLDPGKLDHIVAGGVPAGLTPAETLVKEAAEEAAISADLVHHARLVGTIDYTMDRREGLRRDHLLCYDLILPEDFEPQAADGEVESFELWPIAQALEAVRTSDAFKFNVNLVLIDLFLRFGLIEDAVEAGLRRALTAGGV